MKRTKDNLSSGHCLYFALGNRKSYHNHSRSIHTASSSKVCFCRCRFFPACRHQSLCAFFCTSVFLERRNGESLSQSMQFKGDLRRGYKEIKKREKCNTLSVTEHILVRCRKKGKTVKTDSYKKCFVRENFPTYYSNILF